MDDDFYTITVEGYVFSVLEPSGLVGMCRCVECGAVISAPLSVHAQWHKSHDLFANKYFGTPEVH